jgi:hypothetical protein
VILILKFNEEKLMKMRMEEILVYFTDMQRTELFSSILYASLKGNQPELEKIDKPTKDTFDLIENFSRVSSELNIDNKLLLSLKAEYEQIQKDIKNHT